MKKENLKMYTSAPLPFQGQKRQHVKEFAKVVKQINPTLVIDLFGGSGLLSHVAKRTCPKAQVVYNDYDNYRERLVHFNETNRQLAHIRESLRECPRGSRITGRQRYDVLEFLKKENENGYVDWITLSSSLRFSMNYATNFVEFQKGSMYNRVRRTDYLVNTYLDGLVVVRCDYSELCNQYRNTPHTLFIADPPYLSTDTSTYNSVEYWKLDNYLNVLTALHGVNYVFFTSNKSQIINLCEWLETNADKVRNIFKDANTRTIYSPTTGASGYTDIMVYKADLKSV